MKNKDLQIKVGISLIFALVVWWFWSFKYPYALALQEELQCFLFDREFFMERLAMPAGIARYIGEFLVQFNYKPLIGGLIIAIVLILLQLITYGLIRKNSKTTIVVYVLSFLPVILLWWYMGDVKVKMTFVIALFIAGLSMLLCPSKDKKICKIIYLLIATPIVAWIAGPTVLCLALYVVLRDIRKPIDFISIAMLVYAPACILVSGLFACVPTCRLFYGIHYSLVLDQIPTTQFLVMFVFAIWSFLLGVIPSPKNEKIVPKLTLGVAAFMGLFSFFLLRNSMSTPDYDVMKYDAMVRSQQWDKIIDTAQKRNPDTPLTVASLNLALALKGELLNMGPGFYQNGWGGAFPEFSKQYMTSIVTEEIYFYTGLVNTSERLSFEAMEALPDNAKSSRLYKRMAEVDIINGKYELAKKYLNLLQRTMFYRDWATKTMSLLGNEKAINEHPLYGELRKYRITNDFMFSEQEVDKMMGQLLLHNPNNIVAVQYLLFLPRLEGNKQKEMMYIDFVRTHTKFKFAQ